MSMSMVAQVRDFSKSRGDARFVLTILASYVNPHTGWAWPSLATLAHVTTKGKPYLLKLIAALEALGELEVRRGRGRGHPNHYRITITHEPPPERPRKGNPGENGCLGEKVIDVAEKVIEGAEKGNPSGYSKEILEREKLESSGPEKVTAHDPEEWLMRNAVYGLHRRCGAYHQPGTPCYTSG
jgi:helix-turn-helix protein